MAHAAKDAGRLPAPYSARSRLEHGLPGARVSPPTNQLPQPNAGSAGAHRHSSVADASDGHRGNPVSTLPCSIGHPPPFHAKPYIRRALTFDVAHGGLSHSAQLDAHEDRPIDQPFRSPSE